MRSIDDTSNFDDYNEEFSPEIASQESYDMFEDF